MTMSKVLLSKMSKMSGKMSKMSEKVSKMSKMCAQKVISESKMFLHKMTKIPQIPKIKTKKCQPAARDTPDLIQTECVPGRGLTRHKTKKSTERKKYKIRKISKKWLQKVDFKTKKFMTPQAPTQLKTKKCQPAARDTPDLIQN